VARGRWERDTPSGRKLIRGVLREVTDQHRTQEELEELRRELAHAGRLSTLGQLTSTLAHELRQPLTAMLSNAQAARLLLRMPHVDRTELTAILEDIQRDNSRAAEVIDRLQAMLKRRPMDIQALPIEALLHDVSSILRNDAVRRGVALETSVEAATLVAEGDRVHLSQVLINLIMNAMDAVAPMPPSRRRVAVHARRADAEWIEIAITDSGAGIPTDVLPTIFDPFFTTKPAGMGMGLAISRTIVEAHRGRLTVENNPTDGATFRVVIPRFTAGSSSGQLDRLSGETIERGRQAVRT
jgi:C4-dicarboxylate-specific signal transduction histidine kinase